jgi:hypothetical protein
MCSSGNAQTENEMTPRQQKAIEQFKRFLQYHETAKRETRPEWQKEIVEFTVNETEWTVSVTARIDVPGLPTSNMLRFLESQYWLVFIGPRGGLTAKMYPKQYNQFKAQQKPAFGINFK